MLLGDAGNVVNKGPLSIHTLAQAAPMGKAAGIWLEHGQRESGSEYTPAEGDLVSIYQYASSLGTPATFTGIWGYNAVLHSKGRDVGLCGIEIDIQNETAPASLVPFAAVGGLSKTGITSVLGPSHHDATAAYASSVNLPPGWGDRRWTYGYWAGGVRQAAFHSAKHTNQNGWQSPAVDFSSDTDADVFLRSTGRHRALLQAHGVNLTPSAFQLASQDLGGDGGPRIEVGRNTRGAAGTITLLNADGVPGFLWIDRGRRLRFGTTQPNATLPWTDEHQSVVLGQLP